MIGRGMTRGAAVLLIGVSPIALMPAMAQEPASSDAAPIAPVSETNRYYMRLMMQIFDGQREFSHSQVAGFGRMRQGDESWVAVNFGDGAVVIDRGAVMEVGRFKNRSGVETGLRYNYATRTLSGDPVVAAYHNSYVRPQLGKAPALGSDAEWTAQLTLASLGFPSLGGIAVPVEISRRYISHQGKPLVLLHYKIPAFTYWSGGRAIVQWGEGAALTDPGFGQMYWNAAIHRAVAQDGGASGRPYRLLKTMGAVDEKKRALIDPRKVPEVAPLLDAFYGASAKEVMGFVGEGKADQTPMAIATKLDIMALSIGEDSANQLGEMTSAYTGGARGIEEMQPYVDPRAQQAAAATGASATASGGGAGTPAGTAPSGETMAHDPAHVLQQNEPSTPPEETDVRNLDGGGGGGGQGGGTGSGGGGGGQSGDGGAYGAALGNAADSGQELGGQVDTGDKIVDMIGGVAAEVKNFAYRAQELNKELAQAQKEYASAKTAFESMSRSEAVVTSLKPEVMTMKSELQLMNKELAQFEIFFETAHAAKKAPDPGPIHAYIALKAKSLALRDQIQGMYVSGDAWQAKMSDKAKSLYGVMFAKSQTLKTLEGRLSLLGQGSLAVARKVQALSDTQFGQVMKQFGGAGLEILGKTADALNLVSIGQAGYNLHSVFTGNGGGELRLSRDYGQGSAVMLGLEFASLWGNIASGNIPGFFLDAATTIATSTSDLLVANYGLTQTFKAMDDAEWTAIQLATDRSIQRVDKALEAVQAELDDLREEVENFPEEDDAQQRLAEEMLRQREEARREAERQAEAERQRLIEEARAENERIYQENLKRPPTQAEWDKFNRDIEEAMRPDYPTAPPPTPEQVAERLRRLEAKRLAEALAAAVAAAAEAARIAAEEAERERERQELADAQEEAQRVREQEAEERRRRNEEAAERELEVSPLDTEPVVFVPPSFVPPVWTPPVFDPPVFVPPSFDPPDPSGIPWTDFDDDDYPGSGNMASNWDDMSGIVETDLTKWAAWLETQDQRKLERLALQAGYPNLASALADAHNIIRQSRDTGYRQWANQAPSCGGYVGCGPSYLERWAMKSSIVALGDILNQSREVFSSGGLTDVGISSTRLDYLLRDHGVEDGDIVDVEITQFGRILYSNRITLTNAGQDFTIPLQRGVAGLTIFAVNEGYAIPNTAQVTLDNVVRGEATQQYSLRTGQFATQRIEVGARAENGQ